MPPRRNPQFLQGAHHSKEPAKVQSKLDSTSGDTWGPCFKPARQEFLQQVSQVSTAASFADSSGSDNMEQWPCGLLLPDGIPNLSGEPMKVPVSSYMGQQQPQPSQGASQGIQLPNNAGPDTIQDCMKKLSDSQCLQVLQEKQAATALQNVQLEATQAWQQHHGPVPLRSFNPLAPQNFAAMQPPQGLPQGLAQGLPPGIFHMPQGLPQENQALLQQLMAELSANANAVLASSAPDVVQHRVHDGSVVVPAVYPKGGQGKGKNGGGTEAKGAGRSKKNTSKGGGVPSGDCKNVTPTSVEHNNPQQKAVNCDHHRTIVALNINRLGYDAEEALREHYSQFGKVDYIYMPRKILRVHPTSTSKGYSYLRPCCLAFVIMSTEAEAQAIIALGEQQFVCGKWIKVRCFKQPGAAENEDEHETEQCPEARE